MRNIKQYFLLLLVLIENYGFSQPRNWFGDIVTSNNNQFVNEQMIDRAMTMATQPIEAHITKSDAKFLFITYPGVWTPKWCGSNTNYIRSVNSYLTDAEGAFIYNSGDWDRDLEVAVTHGKYYTFIVGKNPEANNDLSILETTYQPTDIISVTQNNYWVQENESVDIIVGMSKNLNIGEYSFLRYSTDNWETSQIVTLFHQQGSTYKATIPGFPDKTEVSYYILTTNANLPDIDHIDYLSLKINNNGNSNYNYTVGYTLDCGTQIGVVTSEPTFPMPNNALTIFFNAELCNGGLVGYHGDVYIHVGLITENSTSSNDWKYVKTSWGQNTAETKLTRLDKNIYQLNINSIRDYFGVPSNEKVLKIAMVFRSDIPISGNNYREGKNADGSDIFVDVYENNLNIKILNPTKYNSLIPANKPLAVCVEAMLNDTVKLFINNEQIFSVAQSSVLYPIMPNDLSPGTHWIKARAQNNSGQYVSDSISVYMRGNTVVEELPTELNPGINYIDNTTVTLVLNDPAGYKQFAFVIGDFSGWKPTDQTYMKKTPDGRNFWITISGLTPGKEYAYQYYIDGNLKIADPYCDKILDPWNDPWIPNENYPNLKRYPYDQTTGIVSVIKTNQASYQWQVSSFEPVALNNTQQDLIIYELLIRDFVDSRRVKDITDSLDYLSRLGVNAIELMPVIEFDGNESWGYAPNFFFAPDKYYGTKNDYKKFVDECHKRNIAVIIDIVPNHAFGNNPMVMMYFDPNAGEHGQPTSQNPWFNPTARHPYSVGYDFNHESIYTRKFFKKVFEHWLSEYKVDGFRLDLSKGLTQTFSGSDIGAWSAYDQSRINILTDYYNHIKSVNPNAYVILEHFADNSEETVLANTGMLLWGNMDSQFKQVALGYQDNSDFSWAYHSNRGWNYPNCVAFMESHDEERQMHYAVNYGNSHADYNIRDTLIALQRMEMVNVLMLGIPGPKMLWQFAELGYDYSIMYGNDRTFPKPPRWDYDLYPKRKKLFKTISAMIELRSHEAFRNGSFNADLSQLVKRMWISHSSMNVVFCANMGVQGFEMSPLFQNPGMWYEYFSGDSINVTNPTNQTINLPAGAYKVYTNQRKPKPFHEVSFTVRNSETHELLKNAIISVSGSGSVVTDVSGTTWMPCNTGVLTYTVSRHGYFTKTGVIDVPSTSHVDILLDRNPNVSIAQDSLNINKDRFIYPNPATESLYICGYKGYTVSVFNMHGQQVFQEKIKENTLTLNLLSFNKGLYFFRLTDKRLCDVFKIIID